MIDDAGCVRIDLSDPLNPRITGFAPINMSATGIGTNENTIFIYGKHGLAAIDFSYPEKPTVTSHVQFSSSAECVYCRKDSGRPVFYGGISSFIFEFSYDAHGEKFQREILPLFKENGEVEQVYSLSAVLSDNMGFVLILDRNHVHALPEAMPEPGVPAGEKRNQSEQAFKSWLESKFSEFTENRPGETIGHVDCSWYGGGRFMLRLDGERSLPGLHYGPVMYIDDDFQKAEMIQEELAVAMEFADVPEESGQIEYWRAEVVRRSAEKVYKSVIPLFLKSDKFKAAAPAKAYITSTLDKPVVYACIDNGGEWKPWRREISGTVELPLADIIKDFSKWDSYVRKCDTDPEVKKELYSLARSGNEHALQVVRRRFVRDEDDSIEVILHAITYLGQHFWLRFIDDFNSRDDVRNCCRHVYAEGISKIKNKEPNAVNWAEGLIRAAAITGDIGNPEIDPLLDMLLFSEKPDYRHYDLAVMLLKDKKDINQFADSIKRATDAMHEHDNRLPVMSEQLFRAGVYQMPMGLALQSSSEKSGEQYDDAKMGIKILDQPASHYPQCRIERLFTGRKVLERFRDFSEKGDVSSSLWPSDCEPERWPASWKFLMLSLLSQMDIEAELDRFIGSLALRLTGSGTQKPDRELFTALFKMLIEEEDYRRVDKMIDIISGLPADEWFADLHKLRQGAEVNIAWKANNDGNTGLARKLTDKLLAEGVKNSYIYFLDARLAWKDTNDPAICIEIAERHIESMTHGGSGRARLFNLVGCAYDELKRYPEALERFISASNEDHTQIFYFDNIAEVYDKMNESDKAYEWAKEAKRRGSKAGIIEKILEKHKSME
jgi:tetratricopeptide (TPR) repeat protein